VDAIVAVSKRTKVPVNAIVEVDAAAPELHARLSDRATAQPRG
jgi:hypothetical protein